MNRLKQWLKQMIPPPLRQWPFQFHYWLMREYHAWRCRSSVRHVFGPHKIRYEKDEVVVTCLVRNGSFYIRSFIEHYMALGVKHIVFLDNGSEDDTVDLAKQYKHVTILSAPVPLRHAGEFGINEEAVLKRYLVDKFCRNRWALHVDIDEFFDYPFSDLLSLRELLSYLNARSYTAVVTQLLDMFSDLPLSELERGEHALDREKHVYYDISSVVKLDYFRLGDKVKDNVLPDGDIRFYEGGIRKKVFGTHNQLTKHALVFAKGIQITIHCVNHARCADFTAVCYHYKFAQNYHRMAEKYIKDGYGATSEYSAIVKTCKANPDLVLKQETARKWGSVNDLVDNGFLVISNDYLKFVDEHKLKRRAVRDDSKKPRQ